MSDLAPRQADLDYLAGRVDIAGRPTTIVKDEFLPQDPEDVNSPTGAEEDGEKEESPEENNLNLPEEGKNLNLPEDKETDPEPPEAETETPELPEGNKVTETPDPPVDIEPVVEVPSEELLEETIENSEVGEDFEELHEVEPQDDADITKKISSKAVISQKFLIDLAKEIDPNLSMTLSEFRDVVEARAFPTNDESTPDTKWDDHDDGPYDELQVKDDGSKTNRITAKEAGDDNTIYTYDFAFKDFASVGGDTKAQDSLIATVQDVVQRVAERKGMILEWGVLKKTDSTMPLPHFV